MTMYISNSFSLNMLSLEALANSRHECNVYIRKCLPAEIEMQAFAGFQSAVGHSDIAALISQQIHHEVVPNRATIELGRNDLLMVAQYHGPRLPEGATTLPEGARIEWYMLCLR